MKKEFLFICLSHIWQYSRCLEDEMQTYEQNWVWLYSKQASYFIIFNFRPPQKCLGIISGSMGF